MNAPSNTPLSLGDIRYHPASFCDDGGRVFMHQGRLFRGLYKPGIETWDALNMAGLTQDLIDDGLLVETWPADLSLEGFESILEHKRIPHVSYPAEWCPSMLRDAALIVVRLQARLMRHGLLVLDPNPWNVLFDRGRPVYIDLCSIVPTQSDQEQHFDNFYHFFQNYFINPLALMTYGHGMLARALSRDYENKVTDSIRESFRRGRPIRQRLEQILSQALREWRWEEPAELMPATSPSQPDLLAAPDHRKQISRWMKWIETIRLPESEVAEDALSNDPHAEADEPMRAIARRVLALQQPQSVIALGGIRDAPLIEPGVGGVVIEHAVGRAEQYYATASKDRLGVLPVLMNLRNPTPAHGICGDEFASAQQRLTCDVGITVGGVFDLFNRHEISLEQVIDTMTGFCRRGLVVDFTALNRRAGTTLSETKDWGGYEIGNFRRLLEARFDSVTLTESCEDGSALFWCEHPSPDNVDEA